MDVARARPDGEVSVVVVFSVFDGEGKHEVERERERGRDQRFGKCLGQKIAMT